MENRGDFPGGPVVKNLPANSGDMDSISDPGTKIPHSIGQLSPCTTTEPILQSPGNTLTKPQCATLLLKPMHSRADAPQREKPKHGS